MIRKEIIQKKKGNGHTYTVQNFLSGNDSKKCNTTIVNYHYSFLVPNKTAEELKNSKFDNIREQAIALSKNTRWSTEEFVIIYDSNENVERSAYKYINEALKYTSHSMKVSVAASLCDLFNFLAVMDYDITDMDQTAIAVFKNFLAGRIAESHVGISFKLTRKLEPQSVNRRLSDIRNYLAWLGEEEKYLASGRDISIICGRFNVKATKYHASERTAKDPFPKLITEKEYNDLLIAVEKMPRDIFQKRDYLLIKLLHDTGARIGELISLTTEDFVLHDDEGFPWCELLFRSRASDGADRHAKNKNVLTGPKGHMSYDVDYRSVPISISMYKRLMSLIKEDMKEIKRCGKTEKYKKEGKATKLNKKGRTPYYIFINRRFTPLHPSAWNKELKKLFIEAGISVENGHGNSLSHRFRHAFAVRYIYIYKKDRSVVSHLLGHTSYMSLQQYDHPPKELLLEFMSLKSLGRLSEIEDWEFVDDTDEERRLNDILWS